MKYVEYLIVYLIILFKVLLFSAVFPYLITILVYQQEHTVYWNNNAWNLFWILQIISIIIIAILIYSINYGFTKSSSSKKNS